MSAIQEGCTPAALQPRQAAEYLGVTITRLKNLTDNGEIAYTLISERRRVYPLKALDAFLEEHAVPAKAKSRPKTKAKG